jgi:hypothetical protein
MCVGVLLALPAQVLALVGTLRWFWLVPGHVLSALPAADLRWTTFKQRAETMCAASKLIYLIAPH